MDEMRRVAERLHRCFRQHYHADEYRFTGALLLFSAIPFRQHSVSAGFMRLTHRQEVLLTFLIPFSSAGPPAVHGPHANDANDATSAALTGG